MDKRPIGVFDSGIGGLTVVKEILKQLPDEDLIYLGDTARVPYGTRGKETITKFALELTNYLLKKDVKVLVVACNTISATCLKEIQDISPVPVLGVIEAAAYNAVETTKNNAIGVIGTNATISSGVYEKEIKKINPKIKVVSIACPLFVPLVEEGIINEKATELIAQKYLSQFKSTQIDTLILGCTHYPVLQKVIQKVLGKKIKLIDSAKPLAKKLKTLLIEKKLESKSKTKDEYFVTDAPQRVYNVSQNFLGKTLKGKLKEIKI